RGVYADIRLFRSSLSADEALLLVRPLHESAVGVWDTANNTPLYNVGAPDPTRYIVTDASFSADGKILATAFFNKYGEDAPKRVDSIVLHDARSGEMIDSFRPKGRCIRRILLSADGEHLVASAHDAEHPHVVEVWHVPTSSLRSEFNVPCNEQARWTPLALPPHGQLLATSGEGHTVQLWEITTGELAYALEGGYAAATGLTFASNGRLLVRGHADGTAMVWDLLAARPEQRFCAADDATIWADLAKQPSIAYRILWGLAAQSERATAFLRRHVKPAPTVSDDRL